MLEKRNFRIFAKTCLYVLLLLYCADSYKYFGVAFSKMVRVRFDYERPKEIEVKNQCYVIRDILPEKCFIQVVPAGNTYQEVMSRYILYPREISENWDYLIRWLDEPLEQDDLKQVGQRLDLEFATIYAKKGRSIDQTKYILSSSKNPWGHLPNLKKSIFSVIFMAGCYLSIGFLVSACLGLSLRHQGTLWCLTSFYLSGFVVFNFVLCVLLMGKMPFTRMNFLICWLGLAGLLAVAARSRLKTNLAAFWAQRTSVRKGLLSPMSLLIGVIFFLGAIVPIYGWDSMSHWMLKAKMLFHQQALDLSYSHVNNYPFLWSLNGANHFLMGNTVYDAVPMLMTMMAFVTLWGQFIGALKTLKLDNRIFGIPVLIGLVCFLSINRLQPNAETIFLALTCAAIGAVLKWLEDGRQRGYLLLAILMAWGVGLVKFEGFVTSAIIGLSLFFLARRDSRLRPDQKYFILFLCPVIFLIGWMAWANFNCFLNTISHFQDPFHISKIWLSVYYVFKANWISMIIGSGFILFAFLEGFSKWTIEEQFLFLTSAFLCGFAICAIWGWPAEDYEGLVGFVVWRLFIHASPALILWWLSRVRGTLGCGRISP